MSLEDQEQGIIPGICEAFQNLNREKSKEFSLHEPKMGIRVTNKALHNISTKAKSYETNNPGSC